jgi:hypothetical protein
MAASGWKPTPHGDNTGDANLEEETANGQKITFALRSLSTSIFALRHSV